MTDDLETILVVDFGAQYAQLIARRVREARVYSEIVSHDIGVDEMAARHPLGIILSGGPESVHAEWAPRLDAAIYDLGIPILGICYGAQLLCAQLGGTVTRTGRGEYGRTPLTRAGASRLFADWLPDAEADVWMSHADSITAAPAGFVVTAASSSTPRSSTPTGARNCSSVSSSTCAGRGPAGRTPTSSSRRWTPCGPR
jgi:GMP synthase (glutamine-hydrolysing)